MFKLESYLTPLLLNYVDKYIKNLKPEDSQFSLWGGDAVFCNLDLRLDVLEQELQLPFTFVNGHIHELRIHIPWTKLGSEPVVITINTIECILKLCSDSDVPDSDSKTVLLSKKIYSSKISKRPEVIDAPPGYIQSLINRVISNISIVCNNVILKYVEDDIVLSLNIKSVELFSVNDKWEKAFADLSSAVRKVIYMQDLTVCLDKRDASGKIETYQDPLLYRCSSTWRLYSIYNSPHSKYPSVTRIHMFCESLDFSLTNQQIPMFLRLMNLCIALQNQSTFKDRESVNNVVDDKTDSTTTAPDEHQDDKESRTPQESWGTWAWSFIPDMMPIWNASEVEEQEKESNLLKATKIIHFGIYIGKTSCILKQTLVVQDPSCCSSSKFVFSPLLLFDLYGCCIEFTSKGKDFINMQIGISGSTLTGLEECSCGYEDFLKDDPIMPKVFLKSGVPPSSGHAYNFLSSSLFDPLAFENCNQSRKYCFNKEEHLSKFTEEVLVERFPAFAFDYLYELEVPEEWLDKMSTVTTLFLEESNWHESSTCRLVFGPLCVDVTSSLVHRISKLIFSAKDCDYSYYSEANKPSSLAVTIDDDVIDQLEESVPCRMYHLTLFKPVIRLYVADHTTNFTALKHECKRKKKKTIKSSKHSRLSKASEANFCVELYADCVDLQSSMPMYPLRLVNIADKLQDPSHFLLHHCYSTSSVKVFDFEVSLQKEGAFLIPERNIIEKTSLTFFMKTLMLPESWTNLNNIVMNEYTFECDKLGLSLHESQFFILVSIFHSWTSKNFNPPGVEKIKTVMQVLKIEYPLLCVKVYDIKSSYMKTDELSCFKLTVSSSCLEFQKEDHVTVLFNAPEATSNVHKGYEFLKFDDSKFISKDDKKPYFLQFLFQVPKQEVPALLFLHISGSTICFDPDFFTWLSSVDKIVPTIFDSEQELNASSVDLKENSTCSSQTKDQSISQSLTKSQSTLLNFANTEGFLKGFQNTLLECSDFLSHLVLEIDVESLCGLLPQSCASIKQSSSSSTLLIWQTAMKAGGLNDCFIFSFPRIKIKNNNSSSCFFQTEDILQMNVPVKYSTDHKKYQDCFPWTVQLDCMSIYTVSEKLDEDRILFLLAPTTASATVALCIKSNQNQLGLCIHMDCKCVNIILSPFQMQLLVDCFKTISSATDFFEVVKSWNSYFCSKTYEVSECGSIHQEDKVLELSKAKNVFDETNVMSKIPPGEDSASYERKVIKKLTVWSQLTLSKLSVVLMGKLPNSNDESFKVQLDIEEIISSLDIQKVYSKFITKLTSLGANCFVRKNTEKHWQPGPYDGVILFCNNMIPKHLKPPPNSSNLAQHTHAKPDNQPFLVATYTRALCSNAKQKWNLKQNSNCDISELEYISEIDLKVKSFDVVLWMSVFDVICKIFYPLFRSFHENYVNDKNKAKLPFGMQFCSQNLPLLYIETSIVRMYLPENSVLNSNENISDKKENSTFAKKEILLLQLDFITLTSQVENPLSRIILNSDLYYSAINGKTEELSGTAVEDRQYQVDISGLVLGSVTGINILHKEDFKKDLHTYHPLTMGENPALEWNIGVVREKRNSSRINYLITYIVSPIDIRVAIAPAIVCDSPNKLFLEEKIIVAGISLEICITKDVCFYLSDHLICVVYSLLKNNLNFMTKVLSDLVNTKTLKKEFGTLSNAVTNPTNDENVSHFYKTSQILKESYNQHKLELSERNIKGDFVPFEALLTASSVSFTFFYHENDTYKQFECDINEKSTDLSGYESPVHGQVKNMNERSLCDVEHGDTFLSMKTENVPQSLRLHPYLYISLTQPHSYIMCYPESQKFESSCFDLLVNGSTSTHIIQKPYTSCVPSPEDFKLCYLETRPGEPHLKTGIRPAFFTIKITDFLSKPGDVVLSIERPVRCNLKADFLNSTVAFVKHFQNELSLINSSSTSMMHFEVDKKLTPESIKFQILVYFKNIYLSTSQVVFEASSIFDNTDLKMVLSIGNVKVKTEVESCKVDLKSLNMEVAASSLMFEMQSHGQPWNFLHPVNFSVQSKCSFDSWFHVQVCIVAESILLNLSIHHLLKLIAVTEALQDQYKKELEAFSSMVFNHERKIEVQSLSNEVRKRKIWTDDLRKGMFQFTQICEDQDIEPKPNEIVFCPASKNHRASMTWCYPEPRALTKVEVSPVPFKCDDEKSNSEFQIITCYLQYWNSTLQEYVNLCDFVLSETTACALDLPNLSSDSLGVSDKWRVLLDRPTYIDDDGVFGKENPSLSPLALAACMCLDSCFDPSITPIIQVKATCEQVKIIAYNYFEKTGSLPFLQGFKLVNQSPSSHEFAALSFITPVFSCIKWSTKVKGEFSSGLTCEVLEYRNLTMLPVISPVDILCNASINLFQEKIPAIDIELTIQPCFVHLTQSIVHTLMYTLHILSKQFPWLSSFQDPYCDSVLPNYYFICNNLKENVTIGQAGTEEYIHLAPFEMHAYSWWCHKIEQKLRISIEKMLPKWSKEFSLDYEGTQEIILDNDIIFVQIKALSNLQKQVILDGQLVIHNQLHFPLQVKLNVKDSEICYIEPVASMKTSAAYLISPEKYKNLTISISATLDNKLWSSEFFSDDTVLIKIPQTTDGLHCNAWCQVAHQKLTEHSFCITVFISPLFVLRSNLPIPLKVDITSKENDMYTLDLIGKGSEVNLYENSAWDHKLKLDFHSMTDVAVSVSSLTVSVCDLSHIPLKSFTGKENLHEVCHELYSIQQKQWPYSFLERTSSASTSVDPLQSYLECQPSLVPAIASQNVSFRLKVDRVQRWFGLNSVLVDIKPYVMLVNRLNIDLYLFDNGEIQWMLPPNSVAMPTSSNEGFQISVVEDGKHFFSPFLKVDDSSTSSNFCSTIYLSSLQYISKSGCFTVMIKMGQRKVCLLQIKSEVHEGIIVITVFPMISFLNKTNKHLQLSLQCSYTEDKKDGFSISELTASLNCCTHSNHHLLFWELVDPISSTVSQSIEFYYFMYISFSDNLNWSNPLCLHSKMKENSRHFAAVPFKSGPHSFSSEPFVITSHMYEGMIFLVTKNDPCPLLLLHNQTDTNLFYGQSHLNSEGNLIFEETQVPCIIPVLKTNSSSYYMFPAIQEMFPNIPDKIPMLCLGTMNMDNKYLWSAPFQIDIDKQFVHIIGVCDFMIQSKQIGHTINLFIDAVNRVELTAKEIRSRIAQATNTFLPLNDNVSSETDVCDQSRSVLKYINKTKSKSMDKKGLVSPKLPFHIYINARIIHISLKVCDEFTEFNRSIEVVRLNIDNILLFSRPNSENSQSNIQDISLCFERVQFDNQIEIENGIVYDFPVILQKYTATNANSTVIAERDDIFLPNKVRENSMFIMNVMIQLCSVEDNYFILNSLDIKVLPLSLYIEDTFYNRIGILWKSYGTSRCHSSVRDVLLPREIMFLSETFINPIHFQNLKIDISEVSLSLHASLKIYLSLEQSMLRFKPFEKKNLFTTPYEVGRMLVFHYLTGALFRAGWVVGSLDILGNPAGFARAVGAGMTDFIYLPYKGLFQGPRAFVSGLSSGALSLFTQISSSALICFASLASSISRNMDFMCLDDEHLARQELMRCHLPHGVSEGLLQGLSGFGLSILSAIAGIVDHPLKVLISPSTPLMTASGIVGGFGKGIIGMLTKPIGGAAELLSQPVYGLLHGAGWLNSPKRQYQPVNVSFEMCTSSSLKYSCKVAQCCIYEGVLTLMEATYANMNGEYEKKILLLNSEALCVLDDDEITLQSTFPVSEINCHIMKSDRSTLIIVPDKKYKKQVHLESCDAVDRIVEYVKKNCVENPNLEDNVFSSEDHMLDCLTKSTSSYHMFFLYPRERNLFLTLFLYAKSKAVKKGFYSC